MDLYHLWDQLADWNSNDTNQDLKLNIDGLLAILTTQHEQTYVWKNIPSGYLT
jgi:hypothetical protein